jgi:hypothetical protein
VSTHVQNSLIRQVSETTRNALRNPTCSLPKVTGPESSVIELLHVDQPFVNCTANCEVGLGNGTLIRELSLRSHLHSGGRVCPISISVGSSVTLRRLEVEDDPQDVSGGVGRCSIEIRALPSNCDRLRIRLGADWAYQQQLQIVIDGDEISISCAAMISRLVYFDRESEHLTVCVGYEPGTLAPRRPVS